jgi:hypothetical protein
VRVASVRAKEPGIVHLGDQSAAADVVEFDFHAKGPSIRESHGSFPPVN